MKVKIIHNEFITTIESKEASKEELIQAGIDKLNEYYKQHKNKIEIDGKEYKCKIVLMREGI